MKSIREDIIEQKKLVEQEKNALDKKFSVIAGLRLASFLVAIVLIFIGITEKNYLLLFPGLVLLIGFIDLVRRHAVIEEKVLDLKAKATVLNRYLMRLSGEWSNFKNDGSEFLTRNDNLSRDLDLLGKKSIYQLISIAHTGLGRKKLADTLSMKVSHVDELSDRYAATQELAEKKGFLYDFEASSERILERREKEQERLARLSDSTEEKKEIKEDNIFPGSFYILMVIVPLINICSIVFVLEGVLRPTWILITFIAGMAFTFLPVNIIMGIVAPLKRYGSAAGDYYRMLDLVAGTDFNSVILKKIHDRITSRDGLIQAVKSLGRINAFDNISFNPLIHIVLNGFLGWDFFTAFMTYRWRLKNDTVFEESIDILSDIEELGSLSVLSMIRDTTKPEVKRVTKSSAAEGYSLVMKGAYHPIINIDNVVANDASLNGKLTIITGSNMSGKTTFLRTIAVNMILSYVGAGACAQSFSVPYMKLFTSMRVMDDVESGISTFYAEILRIKDMAEYVASDNEVPALCLIDEIFKGTNSADRIVGSEEALKKLSGGNAMVIVTTHDFELCDLKTVDGKAADNYHFEEYYEGSELKFDYTIRDGRCTTRNAMAILKMAGLVQN